LHLRALNVCQDRFNFIPSERAHFVRAIFAEHDGGRLLERQPAQRQARQDADLHAEVENAVDARDGILQAHQAVALGQRGAELGEIVGR
jgi:hypothetical protein